MAAITVESYRATLAPDILAAVDRLRALAVAAHPGLTEQIKWNAPSFALAGEDRITLGVAPRGGVRVVLHRGAKATDAADFRFDDPDRLAAWPAPDRGVLTFRDDGEIAAKSAAVQDLFARWLAATAPDQKIRTRSVGGR